MKLKEETLNSGLPKYRGCKDIEIIWHGDWADPELRYNGYVANYYKIDDEAAVYAKNDGVDVDCEKAFNSFVQQHEDNIGNRIIQTGKKEYNPFEDNEELNESYYGFEQKNGKYYLYSNGVRVRVSKETWENAKEEERQEKIKNMNKKDAEDRKNNEIRLNESQFRNLISESIKSVIKEGMVASDPNFDKWEEAENMLGAKKMLDAIWHYLNSDQILQIVKWLDSDYELGLFNDEEEEEDF